MLIAILLTFITSALAGSPCPPRENIYPCSCLALPQGKKLMFTSVTCHRLPDTDALQSIFSSLRSMTIDHFYLYDSFWEANKLETSKGEDKQALPMDWLTLLKIKEMEIVDTMLSPCFACQSKISCRNSVTQRFTVHNSSSHEKICTICNNTFTSPFSWTGCMNKLRQFHFRNGKLTTISSDLFPLPMRELTEIDFSYNQIVKIEAKTFQNMPRLKVLKLAHNALQSLNAAFTLQTLALEELDVSWNMIKRLSPDFFTKLPNLKFLRAHNNDIEELKKEQWENVPNSLRYIDLTDNPIHCDCEIRWVNETFHINTVILGHCVSPEDYENSLIRKAARMLIERCTEDGKIGTRKRTTKTTPVVMHGLFTTLGP